jgi:hypothetical protein
VAYTALNGLSERGRPGHQSKNIVLTHSAIVPIVVRNSLQALPHPTSVGAIVVGLHFCPVFTLCLFDVCLRA